MTGQLERLKMSLADRYAIERELGAGGMATVYLAHDIKHDRKVAVKVFRPELAAALGSERFFREIKITANLNHPHILPLLDSGSAVRRYGGTAVEEQGEFLYYVMPYVEGESLRDRLNRDRQLPVDDALKITSQVASALSYAHSRDIVHRDIKPENILFQAGEVVVADFGIALAVDSAGGTRLTETGFSLGTPAYMSPEQVSGEQEIDGRSDVYSLACVLYEMLAGDPPFVASSPRAVLAKHMTDPAPPITTVRSDITQPVAAAISKALGKAPTARFQSAKAFSEALFATEELAEAETKSIVVLPFDNLSPDPDNAFFADGLTEEIIADLSQVRDLLVISRSSAMALKGTNKGAKEIAKQVNVRYVLEGSVRKADNKVRITAQLIDAAIDAHLWAQKYNGTMDDVFEIQETVSRAIVDALRIELTAEEGQRIAARPIENMEAYEFYLRARAAINKWTEDGLNEAVRYFQLGLDATGENALLLSGLAHTHFSLMNMGVAMEENRAKALELVHRALASDPEMPKVQALLGYLKIMYTGNLGDVKAGASHLRRALGSDPSEPDALWAMSVVYLYVGRASAAYPLAEKLRQVEPLGTYALWMLPAVHLFDGRYDLALAEFRRLYDLDQMNPGWGPWLALALAYEGQIDEAAALIDERARLTPEDNHTKLSLMQICGLKGDTQIVSDLLVGPFREWCWSERVWASRVATAFALLNERKEALRWLEHSVDSGFINYPWLAQRDRWLENIRGEERFKKLMVRVKKEWEEFEV